MCVECAGHTGAMATRPASDYIYRVAGRLYFRPHGHSPTIICGYAEGRKYARVWWKFYWKVS